MQRRASVGVRSQRAAKLCLEQENVRGNPKKNVPKRYSHDEKMSSLVRRVVRRTPVGAPLADVARRQTMKRLAEQPLCVFYLVSSGLAQHSVECKDE